MLGRLQTALLHTDEPVSYQRFWSLFSWRPVSCLVDKVLTADCTDTFKIPLTVPILLFQLAR